jgi:predicted Zn-dependent protease
MHPTGQRRLRRGRAVPSLLGLVLAGMAGACGPSSGRPSLPRIEHATGVDRLVLDRAEEALAAYARGDDAAALELALVYEANELDVLALAAYDACLALPLSHAEVHFHRARTLAAMGRSEEASQAFAASLALDGDYVPALWRSGSALLDAGRVAEARAQYERAIALEPTNVAARLGLARVQLLGDDPRGALATLEPVVARQPGERFAHGLLARAHQALGDTARAEAELTLEARAAYVSMADPLTSEMRKRATGIIPAVRKANDALAAGKRQEALAILEPVYARDPEKLAIVQMMAKALLENGETARALEVLERGRTQHPDDYKLELLLGIARLGANELEAARTHLVRARALNPDYGPTRAQLGELYARLGNPVEAEHELEAALAADEVELRTFTTLARLLQRQSAHTRALEVLERACDRFPQAPAAWIALAEAQLQGGEREAARTSLAAAEALNAEHPTLAGLRAQLAEDAR